MLGLVVFGSRTWMCRAGAPALAAWIAEVAICAGVTGTAALRPGVSAEPVTAHEMITFRCMDFTESFFATDQKSKTYGVTTTRPMILPARKSSMTAFTSLSGLVATGTCGGPVR